MVAVFIVGATGHMGGAVLDQLATKYNTELSIKALVRTEEAGKRLGEKYPNVTPVLGDLNKYELLEKESRAAEIIINAAPAVGFEEGIKALIKGFGPRERKPFYIHTSGVACLIPEVNDPEKVWDDVKDIEEIHSQPATKTHRKTDILTFSASDVANVAVLCSTWVMGVSPSIEHPLPMTLPFYLTACKALGSSFVVNGGKAITTAVDVNDVASLYVLLVEDALAQIGGQVKEETGIQYWGPDAFYIVGSHEIRFEEFAKQSIPALQAAGLVTSDEVKDIDEAAATTATAGGLQPDADPSKNIMLIIAGVVAKVYVTDFHSRSSRAQSLGWKPKVKDVMKGWTDAIEKSVAAQ